MLGNTLNCPEGIMTMDFGNRVQVRPIRARALLQVLSISGDRNHEVYRGTKAQVERELVRQGFIQDKFDREFYSQKGL